MSVVELRDGGVLYNFDHDFAPSDETGVEWTKLTDEFGLDGSIHVHSTNVNGKPRPVTTEALGMMEWAAAIED